MTMIFTRVIVHHPKEVVTVVDLGYKYERIV